MTFFTETKIILTFVRSHKGPRRAKVTLRKENRLLASHSLTSIYIMQLKTPKEVWNWYGNRHRDTRTERSEINLQPCGQLIHKKVAKNIHWGKEVSLKTMLGKTDTAHQGTTLGSSV